MSAYVANVFLFSEENEEGHIPVLQYILNAEQVEALHYAVENDLTFIPFGNEFHHKDDIVRFGVNKTDEQQYKNM